jgi:hypothetical protein
MADFNSFHYPPNFDWSSIIVEIIQNSHHGKPTVIAPIPQEAGSPPNTNQKFSNREQANPTPSSFFPIPTTILPTPSTWEYLLKTGPQETMLDSLGREGWELCAIIARPDGELWVFKRPAMVKIE